MPTSIRRDLLSAASKLAADAFYWSSDEADTARDLASGAALRLLEALGVSDQLGQVVSTLIVAGESGARDDLVAAFVELGSQLGVPRVVLRQLADDAADYDAAQLDGRIVTDREPVLSAERDVRARLCGECHEVVEACLCLRPS